ncbi:putative lipid II flippase MurJ [Vitis vinifera]|uniref:Putative lipid II flippase MurJ n=1 Tax=Vitis vinifera TaxID=29760 RepID=A0A438H2T0_VITVI|nr:putative lipid II flippase MurJ [Vitis vinifera]
MASLNLHSLHSLHSPPHPSRFSSHFLNTISLQFSSPIPFPTLIIRQFNRISRPYCFNEQMDVPLDSSSALSTTMDKNADLVLDSNKNELIRNAVWVGVATIASKILGLLREIVLASVFGIGPVVTAFKYASVIPGFTASLLGEASVFSDSQAFIYVNSTQHKEANIGVNGPIHITMATTLRLCIPPVVKLPEVRRRKLFQHTNAFMFLVGAAVGSVVFVFAESIIHIYAPGFWVLAEGQITREIAIAQVILLHLTENNGSLHNFCCPVGLGFGYMSAEGSNFLPSISPALSSMLIIATCIVYVLMRRLNPLLAGDALSGGMLISFGASIGAFLQWIIQVIMHERMWQNSNPVPWMNVLKDKDVHEVSTVCSLDHGHSYFFSLMLPATISSGLTQIASFTDFYFASLIPGAAAGISCPTENSYLGLIYCIMDWLSFELYIHCHVLILWSKNVVMLIFGHGTIGPTFKHDCTASSTYFLKSGKDFIMASPNGDPHTSSSTLHDTDTCQDMVKGNHQSMVLILPVLSTMCVLAKPIIRVLLQRYAFDSAASTLVSSLFLCYSLGSPFYIIRELLDAIFYALGDGQQPFLITVCAIALNAILDWLFTSRFHLGAQGLALSTSIVTALSVLILFHLLVKKLAGVIDYAALVCPLLLLFSCCVVSGLTTSFAYRTLQSLLSSVFILRFHRIQELLSISMAGLAGIISFFFSTYWCFISPIQTSEGNVRYIEEQIVQF